MSSRPGFIDGHTHMDAQVFWDPLGTCSCWHGVTTVVMGNCGFTLAPARPRPRALVVRNLERAEDISRAAMAAGIDWSWATFAEYLDAVDGLPKGINYAAQHRPLGPAHLGDGRAGLRPVRAAGPWTRHAAARRGLRTGSITRGLAERLAPGQVVGLDLSAETLAAARRDAAARGLANLEYQEGSVYALPFPDASFDVAFAHQVLQHLGEPGAALREMLRVVRSGGLVAVREVDWGTASYWPADPWIDRFVEVHFKTWYRNGGDPRIGRRLRALFNAAEVTDLRITASLWCYATPAETVEWGESYAERLLNSPMGGRAVEYGYASRSDLEAMAAAFRAWAVHPDAFWAFTHVEALARKPG